MGVSKAQQTNRLKGLSLLLYILGLSYRGVEDVLGALDSYTDHTTVYRNVQEKGERARELRKEWLEKQGGKIEVVGGDLTFVGCGGEKVVIGLAVDAQEGITLDIQVLDNQETKTLKEWLLPILELCGAEVLTTDDQEGFKAVADEAGVEHQVCRRHVTLNLLEFIAKAAERVLSRPPVVPEELDVTVEQLLEDLETLEWILLGHPSHAPKLLAEIYLRYAAAPAPKKGQRATLWYRMRNHALHLWNNWNRLTCYLKLKYSRDLEVEETNNATERAIGWAVKERFRPMRGYKRHDSILNVVMLTAFLSEQPVGYDMSELFVS
jgi:transposase-like protein